MASSRSHCTRGSGLFAFVAGLVIFSASSWRADAQQQTQGFAVERFYPSAPGSGRFVMDDLNIAGGLGGAISVTGGYARNPFQVSSPSGMPPLALISGESFVEVGTAITYNRFRVYLNLPVPVSVTGNSGIVGAYQLNAPYVSVGSNPDTVSDPRLGFDARLYGKPGSVLRLGAGAQLNFPSGNRSDYASDGRYRGMFRFLAAGDSGRVTCAGQFGLHVRPVEGSLPPGGPHGNELLFGASIGSRIIVRSGWEAIVGPEFYGETAVHPNSSGQTGFEGLLTARLEQTGDRPHLRLKLGIGHGIVQNFGAPEWRVLVGAELAFQRSAGGNSKP